MADGELIAKKAYTLKMSPGILRDGTPFAKPNWSDGQWCRFYRQFPKKMAGYKTIPQAASDHIPTGLFVLPSSADYNVYVGDSNSVGYTPVDFFGTPTGTFQDRTPVTPPFLASPYNQWQFDVMYSGANSATIKDQSVLIAFAAPNLESIDSTIERPIYYGPAYSNSRLIPTGFNVSGGIVVLHPYLLMLGNAGLVIISLDSDPTTESETFRIAPYKLLAGRPSRGGNTSPAGLIWSTDRLIRVTQVGGGGGPPEWNFDTISAGISVMSSNCMVEYDTDYYWMGVDRFFYYNGVVQELPNDMNRNFVFNNLNYEQRQKVWATKDTQWGEIWWFYPTDDNLECNKAVIYNVREKTWYDSALARSCGYYSTVFAQPIWAGNTLVNGAYQIWLHDEGVDQNIAGELTAIPSYITTALMSWIGNGPDQQKRGMDRWMSYYRIEPDFLQVGPMTALITYQDYAQSTQTYVSGPYTFNPSTVKIDINTPRQGRESTISFMSNVIGGNYEMGEPVIVATVGDGRQSVPGQ